MSILNEYLNPLINWIHENPSWALFITFLISFCESLAVIGTLVPGSVTMTAIGILAGSGIIRVDLTLIAASLGAIGGDFASYMLGYIFRPHIPNIWPFKNNPQWLKFGTEYFAKHGSKSVLLGRFIGPLRAIIPVIAGMMHMNHWHFLIANVISAIGWSILYILPGVFIGAASTELAAGSTQKLIMILVVSLISLWLLSILIKYIYFYSRAFLQRIVRKFLLLAKKHSYTRHYIKLLTPLHEKRYIKTVALVLLFLSSLILSIVLLVFISQSNSLIEFDRFTYLVTQNIRSNPVDIFFIVFSFLINNFTMLSIFIGTAFYFVCKREWISLYYWIGIFLTAVIVILLMGFSVPRLEEIFTDIDNYSNPITNLAITTALFGFLLGYIQKFNFSFVLEIILYSLLLLAGIATIYLGDIPITHLLQAYLTGTTIALAFWILYRRTYKKFPKQSYKPLIYLFVYLLFLFGLFYHFYFISVQKHHTPAIAYKIIEQDVWWANTPKLPILHSTNLLGRKPQILNIQYKGSLMQLQSALMNAGWKVQSNSILSKLIMKISTPSTSEIPLMSQIFQNKKPVLIMTYQNNGTSFILNLWTSNFYIINEKHTEMVFVGSIYSNDIENSINFFPTLINSLHEFDIIKQNESLNNIFILLIKEKT